MTATTFGRAEVALARAIGLRAEGSMRQRLERCVSDGAAAAHVGVEQFVGQLESGGLALQELVDRVTVQETWFFREPGQLAALAQHILPELAPGPVTMWSAGCANGQEAYTLAMVLEDCGVAGRVLATDVSSRALARADAGRYSEAELRGLSDEQRGRHLRRVDKRWEVVPRIRDRVDVRRNNLVLDPPPLAAGTCDVVFCRNVLIYLEPEEAALLLGRLAGVLKPGGHLFLGSADHSGRLRDGLELVRLGAAFAFRTAAPRVRPRQAAATAPNRPARVRPPVARADILTRTPDAARRRTAGTPLPDITALLATGEQLVASADLDGAISAFRQATCLAPNDPVTHTSLGLALEAAGDAAAATRAFSAARSALDGADAAAVQRKLGGFDAAELRTFLAGRTRLRP